MWIRQKVLTSLNCCGKNNLETRALFLIPQEPPAQEPQPELVHPAVTGFVAAAPAPDPALSRALVLRTDARPVCLWEIREGLYLHTANLSKAAGAAPTPRHVGNQKEQQEAAAYSGRG